MTSIIERIDLGGTSNLMGVLISLTAPFDSSGRNVQAALYDALRTCKDI